MSFDDKTIYLCTHCGSRCGKGAKYCKNCTTASQRKAMDAENKKLNPGWVCKQCDLGWYSFASEKFESGIEEVKA